MFDEYQVKHINLLPSYTRQELYEKMLLGGIVEPLSGDVGKCGICGSKTTYFTTGTAVTPIMEKWRYDSMKHVFEDHQGTYQTYYQALLNSQAARREQLEQVLKGVVGGV